MMLAMLLASSQDTLGKYLALAYPVIFVVWVRYVVHFILVTAMLAPRLPQIIRTERPVLQLFRSLLLFSLTACVIFAMTMIPVAEATAIMFITPLIVTVLSVPLLGEKVGPRRAISVAIGFLGALIIIRPGGELINAGSLLALLAAVGNAVFQIVTRLISRTEHPLTTFFYSAVGGAAASSLMVPFFWAWPAPQHWPLLLVLGVIGASTHFSLIRAFSLGEAVVISPFGYSQLIWATLIGYMVFGELPDRWAVVGALVIAGSGLYILYREHKAREETGTAAGTEGNAGP